MKKIKEKITNSYRKLAVRRDLQILIGFFLLFCISMRIGLPMVNIVNDEMFFVGTVFRAMEAHTLFPAANELPYGVLQFYLSYLIIGITSLFLFIFTGFKIAALKVLLLKNFFYFYLVPRIINVFALFGLVFFLNKDLKTAIPKWRRRIGLLIILISNLTIAHHFHGGKMWALGSLLGFLAFYFLYKSLAAIELDQAKKNIKIFFITIGLAVGNFIFNAYLFLGLPILFYYYRKDKKILKHICVYFCLALLILLSLLLMDYKNVFIDTDRYADTNTTKDIKQIVHSSTVYARYALQLFPIFILLIIVNIRNGFRDKTLAWLASLFFLVYFVVISLAGSYVAFGTCTRYAISMGFYLFAILLAIRIRFGFVFKISMAVSMFYFLVVSLLLAMPTTYNLTASQIVDEYSDRKVLFIQSHLTRLQLPRNEASYRALRDEYCSSRCQLALSEGHFDDVAFTTLELDELPKDHNFMIEDYENAFFISTHKIDSDRMILTKKIGNDVPDDKYYLPDHRLGMYFDPYFFKINNIGQNIYIYMLKTDNMGNKEILEFLKNS